MDFISKTNLQEYIEKNQHTISFITKIYISFFIVQALRFIKEYGVVHLDLKPANIMINNLKVKLIDFGESFHPDFKESKPYLIEDFKPGFTLPYSAPQNYLLQESYTSKNDVFSLGAILHQFFYTKLPFYMFSQKKRDTIYRRGAIDEIIYFCPEETANYGESVIHPIITLLIFKSLSFLPENRP